MSGLMKAHKDIIGQFSCQFNFSRADFYVGLPSTPMNYAPNGGAAISFGNLQYR